MDYLKIGKATDLTGTDRTIYRLLEILPGSLSWITLIGLSVLSYFKPVWVAVFVIAFDVYWLLLVVYLGIHLVSSFKKMKANTAIDWRKACQDLKPEDILTKKFSNWTDVLHMVVLPTYNESEEVVSPTIQAIVDEGYPSDRIIIVYALEARGGEAANKRLN
jgi:hypothetical protein